jgi:hypothetical protein
MEEGRVMKMRRVQTVVAGVALGALLTWGTTAAAESDSVWVDAGLGIGSVFANAVYMPAKVVYATLGTVTGGLTYALTGGSYETAESVWIASLGGVYVVTPQVLTGEAPLEFAGTPPAQGSAAMMIEETPAIAQESVPLVDSYAAERPY